MARGLFRYLPDKLGDWWACVERDDGVRIHVDQMTYEAGRWTPYFEELLLEADWRVLNNEMGPPKKSEP